MGNMDFFNRFCMKVLNENGILSINKLTLHIFIWIAAKAKKNQKINLLIVLLSVFTMSGGPYNYNYIFKYIIIGDMGVGKY